VRLPAKCSAAEATGKYIKMPQAQACTQVKVATPVCGCDDNTSRNNCERQSKMVALKGERSQVRYGNGFGIYNEMIAPNQRMLSRFPLETRYGWSVLS
jgi:hypothetical protein